MTEAIDPKKQWFDVRDSKCRGEDGQIYYNVEARFADHPVIDAVESRKAGHAVYKLVPQVHMHVKKTIFGTRSIKNSTSVVFRFDKGRDETQITGSVVGPAGTMVPHREGKTGLSKPDFDRAIALIMRCWEAWEQYQSFRLAPVWPLEEEAMKIIAGKPKSARGVHLVVGRDGSLVEYTPADEFDEDEDFDPDEGVEMPEHVVRPIPAPHRAKSGRKPKAAAA
jgi:hypothetical protein